MNRNVDALRAALAEVKGLAGCISYYDVAGSPKAVHNTIFKVWATAKEALGGPANDLVCAEPTPLAGQLTGKQ